MSTTLFLQFSSLMSSMIWVLNPVMLLSSLPLGCSHDCPIASDETLWCVCKYIKSVRARDAYMRQQPKPSLVQIIAYRLIGDPDSIVHGANMGPTWVLSATDGPHVGPMNLTIRESSYFSFKKMHIVSDSMCWMNPSGTHFIITNTATC